MARQVVITMVLARWNVPQLLFSAFSNRDDALELARAAAEQLQGSGISSSLHLLDSDQAPEIDASTVVISLGGDGTFLKSARLAHEFGARVLAVNLGRLGFLLNAPSNELVADINHSLSHDHIAERLALTITFSDAVVEEFALNEVVVERAQAGHMVRVTTLIDGDEFLTYSADGVMVATPTGSTGYSFSAGGPVVDATLPVMIVTPIAPHFTIDRSIVVSGEKVVRLVVTDKPAVAVADGRTIGTLEPGAWIEVRRSATPVRVVAARSFDLGFRLREGLREGHA
jgi:NAD+ kinase